MSLSIVPLSQSNPELFEKLCAEHSLRVVECFFRLVDLQYHTLTRISELLSESGYTSDEISRAAKLFIDL